MTRSALIPAAPNASKTIPGERVGGVTPLQISHRMEYCIGCAAITRCRQGTVLPAAARHRASTNTPSGAPAGSTTTQPCPRAGSRPQPARPAGQAHLRCRQPGKPSLALPSLSRFWVQGPPSRHRGGGGASPGSLQ